MQWRTDDGLLPPAAAEHTLAVVGRDDVTAVRFLDGDGEVLAEEPVRPGLEETGPLAR